MPNTCGTPQVSKGGVGFTRRRGDQKVCWNWNEHNKPKVWSGKVYFKNVWMRKLNAQGLDAFLGNTRMWTVIYLHFWFIWGSVLFWQGLQGHNWEDSFFPKFFSHAEKPSRPAGPHGRAKEKPCSYSHWAVASLSYPAIVSSAWEMEVDYYVNLPPAEECIRLVLLMMMIGSGTLAAECLAETYLLTSSTG